MNEKENKTKQSRMGWVQWDCGRGLQFHSSMAFMNDYGRTDGWRNGFWRTFYSS